LLVTNKSVCADDPGNENVSTETAVGILLNGTLLTSEAAAEPVFVLKIEINGQSAPYAPPAPGQSVGDAAPTLITKRKSPPAVGDIARAVCPAGNVAASVGAARLPSEPTVYPDSVF
jgi:hypothetical protein